ncbi:hypothetical protein EIN_522420 [Entamoeba invadens IP1]|uniref:Uncharacterized protein n=1 Tax=Entamoeba invadens IP1 TaxID=370355 RepID=A0A0A1UD98_ENTIV|nr:hypothetical protein EIN_522420 [Entamoeba invadens IP1]ELP91755.1 hypothetical protein EIN_522420 [Entamoeba invadens IP1]|eukprot:XP_004258526.1 hypothetical protein EIN_522420 [Entamoeba invadens IP1]
MRVCEICNNEVDKSQICIKCKDGCKRCFIKNDVTKEMSGVECEDGFALRNEKCLKIENREFCLDELHNVGCESCANYYSTVEISEKCSPNIRNMTCSFYNENGEYDESDVNCQEGEYQKGHCLSCQRGFALNLSNPPVCTECGCRECNKINECKICINESNNNIGICTSDCNCISSTNNTCLKCTDSHHITKGKCETCDQNCVSCSSDSEKCLKCEDNFVLVNDKCVSFKEINCITKNDVSGRCEMC